MSFSLWTTYWLLVAWMPKNTINWNFNQNTTISFQEIAFEMLFAKWYPFCSDFNIFTHGCMKMCCLIMYWVIKHWAINISICKTYSISTNAGILLIRPLLGTNFSEISIAIHTFSFTKMHFKMSSGKCRPFCLGLNVLRVKTTPVPNQYSELPVCLGG